MCSIFSDIGEDNRRRRDSRRHGTYPRGAIDSFLKTHHLGILVAVANLKLWKLIHRIVLLLTDCSAIVEDRVRWMWKPLSRIEGKCLLQVMPGRHRSTQAFMLGGRSLQFTGRVKLKWLPLNESSAMMIKHWIRLNLVFKRSQ